jgi:hypothetical protein
VAAANERALRFYQGDLGYRPLALLLLKLLSTAATGPLDMTGLRLDKRLNGLIASTPFVVNRRSGG